MEPITVLIYIAISHYSWAFISNIFDYAKLQSNHREIKKELYKIRYIIKIANNGDV
jgi:hypothetical protein